MLIVGFGHKARQGKNTAAAAFLEQTPLETRVHMYAFADALKQEVRVAAGRLGGPLLLIEQFKTAGLMPDWVRYEEGKQRSLYQWWGTDYRRAKDPEYWVRRLAAKLDEHKPEVALITDVRMANEVEFIRSRGGVVVRVTRTTPPDVAVAGHVSERELDGFKFDYELEAANLAELKTKTAELYREIKRRFGLPQPNEG